MTLTRPWAIALGILLVLSLCLNVLVLGAKAGRMLADPRQDRASTTRLDRFLDRMPEEARPILRESFEERRAEIAERVERLREARRRVAAEFQRDPVDPAALSAALAVMRAGSAEAQQAMHEAMVEAAPKLAPEMRREIAGGWADGKRRGKR